MEIWKPIEGYENRYEVSNKGNVRSLNYRQTGEIKTLKPIVEGKGYPMVGLCQNNTMKWHKVHRLVATAFIPNPDNRPQINHINGIKTDNRVENLEWATNSENLHHAYKQGLREGSKERGRVLGATYGKKLVESSKARRKPIVAINILTGAETLFESAIEVERVLGIDHSSIPKVCNGRQKTAKGYKFRYAEQSF